jgi:hypothetical protein
MNNKDSRKLIGLITKITNSVRQKSQKSGSSKFSNQNNPVSNEQLAPNLNQLQPRVSP